MKLNKTYVEEGIKILLLIFILKHKEKIIRKIAKI